MLKEIKTVTLTGLTALVLTSAFSLQAQAQGSSQYYKTAHASQNPFKTQRSIKQNNNTVVGGLLGAVAGGVIGSQLAGNGARTEGSVLGALIGGAAGAAIADNNARSRQFDNYRGINGTQPYNQTYRRDFGYAKYGNSEFEGYNRRGFYNDNLINSGSSASGLPYYKGFGTQLGPHKSTKRTSLLGRRF